MPLPEEIDYAILPGSYAEVSVENVQATKQLLRDLWKSAEPELDVDHGALDALVLAPSATLLEVARETFRNARNSSSFTALLADPSGATEKVLDELAKSYRVERRKGTIASGRIRLFFQEDLYRVIGLSTTFTANGVLFHPNNVETLQLSGDIPSTLPHYQNLCEVQDGSGLYCADITVYARSTGTAANLVRGTELKLYQSALSYFVRAIALETFQGGENDEDAASLIRRMVLGVSAKVLSSRVNMRSALLEQFPDLRDSSVIGAGDLEMTRDKHTLFPGSVGGYADWYVGTTRQLAQVSCVLDTVLHQGEQPDGTFLHAVTIDDSQVSCLYHVTDLQDEETLDYAVILSQTRTACGPTGSLAANVPLLHDDEEGAFTAYQVTEVRFTTQRPVQKIRLYGLHMPGIKAIQDWVLQSALAPIGLDVLVKGAIPTTVRFSAVLHTPSGETIDFVSLQTVVADHINHLPFDGLLAVSELTAILHRNLPRGSYVTRMALFATTWLPDGRSVLSQTSSRLEINFPPFASNRTTLFFCDPIDVSFEHRYLDSERE